MTCAPQPDFSRLGAAPDDERGGPAAAGAAAAAALFVSLDDSRGGDVRTLEIGERDVELIAVDGGAAGPESVAFDAAGEGPYTGVSDGRVLKWLPLQRRWVEHSSASNEPQRLRSMGAVFHGPTPMSVDVLNLEAEHHA
uniref:Uncharacterized protein n=1 Tax=Oryza brachyantha TaxID=4533 RepID=J3NBA1_ORYBR